MLIMRRCHQVSGFIGLFSHNSCPKLTVVKCTALNFCSFGEIRSLSTIHDKYTRKMDLSTHKIAHTLSRTEGRLSHITLGDLQQKRYLSIAAKLVNNASPKVQPYMKLMRIDKPIGEALFNNSNDCYL